MRIASIALVILASLLTQPASAQSVGTQARPPNLSGIYRCVHNCFAARFGRVVAVGTELVLTRYDGTPVKAWIDWAGHIWVPSLGEGAVYSADGFTIQFERGSVWVLVDPQPVPGSAAY